MLCILLSLNVTAFADGKAVPYAEENGFEFTAETEFEIPVFFYLTRDDKYLPNTDECKIEAYDDATYTISDLSLSEPDEDGIVELTFTLEVQASTFSARTPDNEDLPKHTHYTPPGFFDYYSGYSVTVSEDNDNVTRSYFACFTTNGKDVAINGHSLQSFNWSYGLGSWNKYNQREREYIIHDATKYTLKFPADYDGLCIAQSKRGVTEYNEDWSKDNNNESYSESKPFLDWLDDDETASDYYMLRVSDLLAQAA